jgi:hypothetical protein
VSPSGVHEDVRGLWLSLGEPPVVALGKKAMTRVHAEGIPLRDVPHPQWWRRFNRKAGEGSYGQLLQEAAS